MFMLPLQSMVNDTVSMRGRSAMDNVEMAYARQVGYCTEKVAVMLKVLK